MKHVGAVSDGDSADESGSENPPTTTLPGQTPLRYLIE